MGMPMRRPWLAFFSQTGSEIYNLSNELGIYPDCIVTNQHDTSKINIKLLKLSEFRQHKLGLKPVWALLPQKPAVQDYAGIIEKFDNPVITLHGYLRIIPPEICNKYQIYNLHPGLIDKYPLLKGFNPQERAFRENYKTTGCVIHRVTPEVDGGEIVARQEVNIENLSLTEVYNSLHNCAFNMWKNFITDYNILK